MEAAARTGWGGTAVKVRLWPSYAALLLAAAMASVALLGSPDWSLRAYLGLLLLGSLLIYAQRRLVISASSKAGASRYRRMSIPEKAAVWAILAGCLPNAVVWALDLARIVEAA